MNDPIADMLSRIRNAAMAGHDSVSLPYSKIKETIVQILKKQGYIEGSKIEDSQFSKTIIVQISKDTSPQQFESLERISKPGRRVYAKASEIPYIRNGMGEVIISTSQGLMTGSEARTRKLGGELICKVY